MTELMKRDVYEATALLASTTETSSDSGDDVRLQSMINGLAFTLDVTDANAAGGDALSVYVQTKSDGTNWVDVVRFDTILGNGGALRYVEKISAAVSQAGFEVGAALTAGNVRHLIGDDWRVRWVVAGATASFTFSVVACPC